MDIKGCYNFHSITKSLPFNSAGFLFWASRIVINLPLKCCIFSSYSNNPMETVTNYNWARCTLIRIKIRATVLNYQVNKEK